jgi:hypothetical protein
VACAALFFELLQTFACRPAMPALQLCAFASFIQDTEKEDDMNKLISILFLLLIALGVSACSSPQYGNSPEQQRKNAKEAQDELSTDVNRGTR